MPADLPPLNPTLPPADLEPLDSTLGHALAGVPQRAGIQSVEVGFALLQALADAKGPLMLRDLAAAAGMNAAKAHRYLVSFQRLALVVQDPANTRYDLGPAALKLGLASLARLDGVKLARQRLSPLLEQIGQTLALAVWGHHGPTIVHWEASPDVAMTLNLRLGDVMPLLSSATGLCFAAFMTAGQQPRDGARRASHGHVAALIEAEMRQMQALARPDLPASSHELEHTLDDIRSHGLARVINTLLPGVAAFCAPVFDADGHLALGMVALGSIASFDSEWQGAVAMPLLAAAQQLSADLGYTGIA